MISNFSLLAGILAASTHVISGPDHLAAVTPLAVESKKKAWKIGLAWGFGHVTGMLFIGLLFLLFKDYIPVDEISKYSEKLVGLILLVIGLWVFYKIFKKDKNHKLPHFHTDKEVFVHVHKHDDTHTHTKEIKQHITSSFGIGLLHGLAGIAHFLLLLPILSFETKTESVLYLIGFAIGTVLVMMLYAFILGSITVFAKEEHNPIFFKGIQFASGLFAVIIGIYWLYLTY